MKRIFEWECGRGHHWSGKLILERNASKEERMDFVHVCEVCGKVCASKGGLTIHRKRMHEVSTAKKTFQCDCGRKFSQEANLLNHRKACDGEEAGERRCELCNKKFKSRGFKSHQRRCAAKNGVILPDTQPSQARGYKGKRKECPECGNMMAGNSH